MGERGLHKAGNGIQDGQDEQDKGNDTARTSFGRSILSILSIL
jgi:hypothetical protein